MKKLLILLSSLFLLNSPSVFAETVLYCQSELATGFIQKNDSWKVTNFKLKRLTIKFNSDYSKLSGLSKYQDYICSEPYGENSIACTDEFKSGRSFLFSKEKKRFVYSSISSHGGYDLNLPNADTETIYAGTCTSF